MTHNTGPSQNTRAQKRKLEEILTETPEDDEFDDQLLCFELMTSLNADKDVVKHSWSSPAYSKWSEKPRKIGRIGKRHWL